MGITIDNLLLIINDWSYMKNLIGKAGCLAVVVMAVIALTFGCQPEKKNQAQTGNQGGKKNIEGPKMVKLQTSKGDIVIELDEKNAPASTTNFLRYVESGFYNGTIFHRVIPNFMIQGGGHNPDMQQKPTLSPIINEASNGLKNNRGTVAMARTSNPNSATSQFFINLINNDYLNYAGPANPGYAVFGKVVDGMDVVDAIAQVKTGRKGPQGDVPVEPVIINSAAVIPAK
jgi:cyclophilin family peptidyl-prolyl cis-trans isomerase